MTGAQRCLILGLALCGAGALSETHRAHADAPPGHFLPGDGVVIDSGTKLTWQTVPRQDALRWSDAQEECDSLVLGGFAGWRVPTWLELQSLIDSNGLGPVLLDPSFGGGSKSQYWSATRYFVDVNVTVDVQSGATGELHHSVADKAIVRCVR